MVAAKHLTKISKVENPLRLHTNAGMSQTDRKGYLGNTPFWLDEGGIANVISLQTLESKYRVHYDSMKDGGSFVCETLQRKLMFACCVIMQFPYINLSNNKSEAAAMLIQTVRGNFEG